MGKSRQFVRELGHRRSARIEAIEISKTAAAADAAARAATEARTPREPPTDPVRRRGRKKQKCRTVEAVVVNSVETGLEEAEDNDNPNHSLIILGSQSNPPNPFPPDKHVLDFVLDMLQKNDKERIFAEPVNPLEVEHYYDIIKHPMDLSTMRVKLHEGKYETLEQFETDVFLMSENAMTFNDNSTIYYQEAFDMRYLAAKIFRALRSHPGSCKFEEIFDCRKMSKSVTSGVNIQNEGGSPRFQESASLAIPSSGKKCGSSGHNSRRKNAPPVSQSIYSDPFAENARAPGIHLGSRGGRKSLIVKERQNACRPFASFLSKDEATASIVYDSKPATLIPVNKVNYIESLRKFAKNLGPKAQEIAERKIQQCELREQQLQTQREIANRIHEQSQAEERQMRAKGSLTQQTAIVPNEPHKFPTAPHGSAVENTSHQSIGTQTLSSNLQSRGQVNPAYDCTRLGMSSNQLPPNSSLNFSAAQFAPGEFTSALTGGLVTKVGEHCLVMASIRVPPSDLGQSLLPQESNPTGARVPSSDPGPSFLTQGSNLGGACLPPSDPGPSFVAQQRYLGGAQLLPSDPGPSFIAQQSNLGGAQLPPSDPGPSVVEQQSYLRGGRLPSTDPGPSFLTQGSNLGGACLPPSDPGPSFVAQQRYLGGAQLLPSDPGPSFIAQQSNLGGAQLPPTDPGPSFVEQQSYLRGGRLPSTDPGPSFVAQQSNLGGVWLPPTDPGPSFVAQQSNLGGARLPPTDPGPSFVAQQSNLGGARLPPTDPGPSFVAQQSNLGDVWLPPSYPGPSLVAQQGNLGGARLPPTDPGPSFVAQQGNLGGVRLPPTDPGPSFVAQQSNLGGAWLPPTDPGPSFVAQQSNLGGAWLPPTDPGPSFVAQQSNLGDVWLSPTDPGPSFVAQQSNLGDAWFPLTDPGPSFVAQQSNLGGVWLPPSHSGPSFVAQHSNLDGVSLPPSDPGSSFVAQHSDLDGVWLPPSDPGPSFVLQQSNLGGAQLPPSDPESSFVVQQSNMGGAGFPPSDPGPSFVAQQSNLGGAWLPPSDPGPSFVAQQSNLGGSWLPPSDPGPSFVAQQSNLDGVWLPPSDPGSSFVAQESSLAPGPSQTGHSGPVAGTESDPIPQSWLWQAKDPSSSNIVHPMHALQVETVVNPTEAGRLHSESTQNQTGLILSENQAATWVERPGFGAGALPGPSQLQQAHIVDLSHHWSSQMDLNQFEELVHFGSSSSANQAGPWEMQTLMETEGGQPATNNNQVPPQMDFNHFHRLVQEGQRCCNQTDPSSSRSWDMQGNAGFEGDQPIMTQFPDSALMGPGSPASPAVAWQMQSTGADGDHQFTGHHQLQGSLPIDLCQGLPMIEPNQTQRQGFSQAEPTQNWVHHMYPTSSEAQPGQLDIQPRSEPDGDEHSRQIPLNQQMGSSPDGPVDLLPYQHYQQKGSSLAGPVDLLTQLQKQQMGSSPDGPVDLLTDQHNQQTGSSVAGRVDLLTQVQNQQMGSSSDGPVDLQTYQHNQQMGSSPAGPVDLPTQLQNQQMGSSSAGPVDLLNHPSTMGIFDLALVESCLRSAACRNLTAVRREPPEP